MKNKTEAQTSNRSVLLCAIAIIILNGILFVVGCSFEKFSVDKGRIYYPKTVNEPPP